MTTVAVLFSMTASAQRTSRVISSRRSQARADTTESRWVSFQHYFKVPTAIRTNVDLIFVMGVQNERVLKSLWEEYGGLRFNDVKALKEYALQATEIYGALGVDNMVAAAKGSEPCARRVSYLNFDHHSGEFCPALYNRELRQPSASIVTDTYT